MAAKMKCAKCGAEIETPKHCNRPMQVQKVRDQNKLVCWMGPGCATAELPQHCGTAMRESAA
jgi:hypothetical protein